MSVSVAFVTTALSPLIRHRFYWTSVWTRLSHATKKVFVKGLRGYKNFMSYFPIVFPTKVWVEALGALWR